MTRKEALAGLIEKVEAGNADGRCRLTAKAFSQSVPHSFVWAAMDGSLDAAKALHEAVLPEWDCTLSIGASHASLSEPIGINPTRGWYPGPEAEADTPARAWLIAILRALYAREPDT